MIGAEAKRGEETLPSIELNQQLLDLLANYSEGEPEFNQELLKNIVSPMFAEIRRMIHADPEAAKNGITIAIEVKGEKHAAQEDLLTTAEVAELYRMSQQQVRRWCEAGQIQAYRGPGGSWRIPSFQFRKVGILAPFKKERRPIEDVAGVWKNREDLVALYKGRE